MELTNQLQLLFKIMSAVQGQRKDDSVRPQPTWVYPGPDPDAAAPAAAAGSSRGPEAFEDIIQDACQKYRVQPELVRAVIKAESNHNPEAVSSAGAKGLMQLMPATARSLGVKDAFDPEENIHGGVRLLRQLLNRYHGDVDLALAAYNAGTVAVDRYQDIPPFRETQIYVPRVKKYMQQQWTV